MATIRFPTDFAWGAATSAYQIEGAWNVDGRGESIWDRFSHTPGNIEDGTNGDQACDHYHRWPDDIKLMQELGLKAYRFSLAWPRIIPTGRGQVNQAGLDFYSRLIDGLLEAGITPYPTLYHWDLPQILEDQGGWPNRDTAYAFADYADIVTRYFSDRITVWTTLNEPAVSAWLGYLYGIHAPGRSDLAAAIAASHHLLLGHGLAIPIIRRNAPQAKAGIVIDIIPYHPASGSPFDKQATALEDGRQNRWFLDPLAGRGYPAEMVSHFGTEMAFVQPDDLKTISTPLDFVGINYYRRYIIRDETTPDNWPQTEFYGEDITEMDWEVRADSLFEALNMVNNYKLADELFVTENGAAYADQVSQNGTAAPAIHDTRRTNYYKTHLTACAQAIEAGIPLKGYFAWSLMDNFEWGLGYSKRFGLVHVDFETQARTIKDSGLFYRNVIAQNGW